MSLSVQECAACQARLFPARLFCPVCGGDSFRGVEVDRGTVEESSTMADGTVLATLELDGGSRVIARLSGTRGEPGLSVPLTHSRNAGPGVHAYIPSNPDVSEDSR